MPMWLDESICHARLLSGVATCTSLRKDDFIPCCRSNNGLSRLGVQLCDKVASVRVGLRKARDTIPPPSSNSGVEASEVFIISLQIDRYEQEQRGGELNESAKQVETATYYSHKIARVQAGGGGKVSVLC